MIQVNEPMTTARIQKAEGTDTFDGGARDDRGRGPAKQKEGRPEHAIDARPEAVAQFHAIPHDRVLAGHARAAQVRAHQLAPWHRVVGLRDAAGDARTIGEGEVNPPAKEEEGHGHQRNEHGVFHQRVNVIFVAGCADLIHAEPYMDQEHERYSHPIIELGEYHRQSTDIGIHSVVLPFGQLLLSAGALLMRPLRFGLVLVHQWLWMVHQYYL